MNDEAREVLVAAALRGHRQVRGEYHAEGGGDCALGVLHRAAHADGFRMTTRRLYECDISRCVRERWDLAPREGGQIRTLNDNARADFLTISRKVGVTEETP